MANYEYSKAQEKAYNVLKKKQPYAVIYAYSQGDGKVILNPPLVKHNQEQVQAFVDSFRRPRQQTRVTVDVFYLSQLERLEDFFEGSDDIEEDIDNVSLDEVDPVWFSEIEKVLKETKNALKEPESLEESAKIIVDIQSFNPWAGAIDIWEILKAADKLEELDFLLEDAYPDGITATELNDLLWFESDWIYEMLNITDDDVDNIRDEIAGRSLEPIEVEEEQ